MTEPRREDSSWRYAEQERAQRYGARKHKRMAQEAALLRRLLEGTQLGERILDVPCGTGRLAALFGELGLRYSGCDAAHGMLLEARHSCQQLVQGRLPELPFADQSFDSVICFRYLHHAPPVRQSAVLAELARLARRHLMVSAFHPISAHELQRKLRVAFRRKERGRWPTAPRELDAQLAGCGFHPLRHVRQGIFRDLWIGLYERR
jgi:ubiquinone/menaquinone biosynthesis C-methylase UbiE